MSNNNNNNEYILFYQDDNNFLLKRNKILQDKFQYPKKNRTNIDELITTFITKDDTLKANTFAKGVFYSIVTFLCNGCNIRRETIDEVEAIIRLFPKALIFVLKIYDLNGDVISEQYPISCQSFIGIDSGHRQYKYYKCNPNGVVFLPLFVRLLMLFEPRLSIIDTFRGGLLLRDTITQTSVLKSLVMDSNEYLKKFSPSHYNFVDARFATTMVQLKEQNVLKLEDIYEYDLLNTLCFQASSENFPVKRFKFLVE